MTKQQAVTLDHPRRIAVLALFGFATIALIAVVLLAPSADARRPSCKGKAVTISSNKKVIKGTHKSDVIKAGGASSTIMGLGGSDTICAGGGNDKIYGGKGSDTIYGEGGNDYIDGGTGKETVDGGPGNDEIHGGRASDTLMGGSGTDTIYGDSGNDKINGGPGDGDYVNEGLGDGSVNGGPGDGDIVVGEAGNDKINGGPGANDFVDYAPTSASFDIDLGAGTVRGGENESLTGIENVITGSGDDHIVGSDQPNKIDGGPGDDVLVAVGAGDQAFGGPGNNQCNGPFAVKNDCGRAIGQSGTAVTLSQSIDGSSVLTVTGNAGEDDVTINYSGGAYVVASAGPGNDVLLGSSDSPSCTRDAKQNSVTCTGRVDRILASMDKGDDKLIINQIPASVSTTVDGGPGSDDIEGGPGRDSLFGGDDQDPDILSGGDGDDVLFGINTLHPQKPSGQATMTGGGGNDLMVGGQPCSGDIYDGGPGANDSASFARVRNGGRVTVKATIGGSVSDPDIKGCNTGRISGSTEKIEGSTGPDILTGDGANNTLLGRGGNDQLDGAGGTDSCIGGGGRDTARSCERTASIP